MAIFEVKIRFDSENGNIAVDISKGLSVAVAIFAIEAAKHIILHRARMVPAVVQPTQTKPEPELEPQKQGFKLFKDEGEKK